jgi:hypothetical protein
MARNNPATRERTVHYGALGNLVYECGRARLEGAAHTLDLARVTCGRRRKGEWRGRRCADRRWMQWAIPMRREVPTEAKRLRDLSLCVSRLRPDRRDPEAFHVERDWLAKELRRLARALEEQADAA